jgi:2-polyprenyl-3-methyl-5-hydroxy-6-metoxy-1,4-benzoquinol methylase
MTAFLCTLAFVGLLLAQPATTPDDAAIWAHYEAWVAKLPALAPGERKPMAERYVEQLVAEGVSRDDALKRFQRIGAIRRQAPDKEMVYWNGAFKSGGGPDAPLQLLQETIRYLKPGKVLEPGMGRGRNAIWLASQGWDVTGYDIAADALKVAQADAARAKVSLKTIEASHDSFAFGDQQWDLILCAYCYMDIADPRWPTTFARALRPGGVVVFQTSVQKRMSVAELVSLWKDFHILRAEDLDAGMEMNDWAPSRTVPTARLVARRK